MTAETKTKRTEFERSLSASVAPGRPRFCTLSACSRPSAHFWTSDTGTSDAGKVSEP